MLLASAATTTAVAHAVILRPVVLRVPAEEHRGLQARERQIRTERPCDRETARRCTFIIRDMP